VRYIRLEGSEAAGEPGSEGLNLDAVAALHVAPAGSLLAGALELVEQGDDLLVAEPLSGRSMLYLGHPLDEPDTPADEPTSPDDPALPVQPFEFQLATPVVPGGDDTAQSGVSLLNGSPDVGDALAFEGAASDEMLRVTQSIGDINGDGADDLMLVGAEHAYVLFGPVALSGIENVAEAAEIVINQAEVGRPAERMGDIDGDGFNDLLFARSDGGSTTITVITGTGLQWPRLLDAESLGATPEIEIHLYTITLDASVFGEPGAGLHALNWDGDENADILVAANQPVGGTVGYLFSGADLVAAQQNGELPLDEGDAIKQFTVSDDPGMRSDLATELLGGVYTPQASDLGSNHYLTALVPGDVDGDGRDDILFADSGFLRFQGNLVGLPDAGRVYLVPGGEVYPEEELGFANGQESVVDASSYVITAETVPTGKGANAFQLSDDATLIITFPDITWQVAITLSEASTSNNENLDDLVGDLNQAIAATIYPGYLWADSTADGRLQLFSVWAFNLSFEGELDLDSDSQAIWQDFSLGAALSAVGDLNHDGYDEIAFSRPLEGGEWADGGLFIVEGSTAFASDSQAPVIARPGDSADFIFHRPDTGDLYFGEGFGGPPQATAGDFDADGRMDLAIGLPTNTQEAQWSGRVYVFFGIGDRPGELLLSEADVVIQGDREGDGFGTLPMLPGIDINGDRVDDLLVGGGHADATATVPAVLGDAGKIYAIHGKARALEMPAEFVELGNREITGSGFYLVDRGTGRPEPFSIGEDFTLEPGEVKWYRFTTLGDGRSNNIIHLTPDSADAEFEIPATDQATLWDQGFGLEVDRDLTLTVGDQEQGVTLIGSGHVGVFEFDLLSLLPILEDPLALQNVTLSLPIAQPVAETAQFALSVAAGEGDGVVTVEDATGEHALKQLVELEAGETRRNVYADRSLATNAHGRSRCRPRGRDRHDRCGGRSLRCGRRHDRRGAWHYFYACSSGRHVFPQGLQSGRGEPGRTPAL